MEIVFDNSNSNVILFKKDGKRIYSIACPPIKKGCDVINLTEDLCKGYKFNTDSFILITSETERKLYYKGDLITETKRKHV